MKLKSMITESDSSQPKKLASTYMKNVEQYSKSMMDTLNKFVDSLKGKTIRLNKKETITIEYAEMEFDGGKLHDTAIDNNGIISAPTFYVRYDQDGRKTNRTFSMREIIRVLEKSV